MLRWCLNHKLLFLTLPGLVLVAGLAIWLGPGAVFGRIPQDFEQQSLSRNEIQELSSFEQFKYELAGLRTMKWEDEIQFRAPATRFKWTLAQSWHGLGSEFMPPLDEGSYLYMPTTMSHASLVRLLTSCSCRTAESWRYLK